MERHCDHRLDLAQVHIDHAVIICACPRIQFLIVFASAVDLVKFPDLLVCRPDGGQAGGLCRHHVHADPEVRAQLVHAGSYKFHHLIVDITISKGGADDRQGYVLGTHSLPRLAVQVNADHARHLDIIGLIQKLLHKLRPALAHGHGAQRAVAGMAVRTKDHPAAARKHLPRVLMDDRLMRRYIDTAVFLRAGQPEHMVIFIDRTAHRAQGIVAVGQHIGDWELLQPRSPSRLDDPHERDIMGGQLVKSDLQVFHIARGIVVAQDAVSHRLPRRFLLRKRNLRAALIFDHICAVQQIDSIVIKFYHDIMLLLYQMQPRALPLYPNIRRFWPPQAPAGYKQLQNF